MLIPYGEVEYGYLSPTGKWMVLLSYGYLSPTGKWNVSPVLWISIPYGEVDGSFLFPALPVYSGNAIVFQFSYRLRSSALKPF